MSDINRCLFISDIHIKKDGDLLAQSLFYFLQKHHHRFDHLYLLGDIFDAWIGIDDGLKKYQKTLNFFASLSKKIFFIKGNHDFLLQAEFLKKYRIQLLDVEVVLTRNHHQILISHGDLFCTFDQEYQKMRAGFQNPQWIESFLKKPLLERAKMLAEVKAKSAIATTKKDKKLLDVNENSVLEKAKRFYCNVVIHGHTHKKNTHQNPKVTRYVLGDWESFGANALLLSDKNDEITWLD